MQPVGDRVLVVRDEAEEVSPGGILLPEEAQEKPACGTVAAVGKGIRTSDGVFVALEAKAGDRIIFNKYGGTEVDVGGDKYTILRESDILLIL